MSESTRHHEHAPWLRIRMIANSRAHRAMKSQTLGLPANLCPAVDKKFKELAKGAIKPAQLREWLGQVHTDFVNALEQAHVGWIKTRIRLVVAERTRKPNKKGHNGRLKNPKAKHRESQKDRRHARSLSARLE